MNNKFEDDEVLAQLSKSARKTKEPKLDEGIIKSAISRTQNVGRRKFSTPALMFNLAGATAVIVGVFVVTGTPGSSVKQVLSNGTLDQFSKIEGSMALAMGHVKINEEDLLARDGKSLAEFGQSAVGNYVSNSPLQYVDEIWTGKGGTSYGNLWVFVVTDAVYFANFERPVLRRALFADSSLSTSGGEDQVIRHPDQIASSSDADGIRLLIQGDSNILYPLVVPVNEEPGSLYRELRDYILGTTFTKVPTF